MPDKYEIVGPISPLSTSQPLVQKLIKKIGAGEPIQVDVVSQDSCKEADCFNNVRRLAEVSGEMVVDGVYGYVQSYMPVRNTMQSGASVLMPISLIQRRRKVARGGYSFFLTHGQNGMGRDSKVEEASGRQTKV